MNTLYKKLRTLFAPIIIIASFAVAVSPAAAVTVVKDYHDGDQYDTVNDPLYSEAVHTAFKRADETGQIQAVFHDPSCTENGACSCSYTDSEEAVKCMGTYYVAPVKIENNEWTFDQSHPSDTFKARYIEPVHNNEYDNGGEGAGGSGFFALAGDYYYHPLYVLPTKTDFCSGLTGNAYDNCSSWRDHSDVSVKSVKISNVGKHSVKVNIDYEVQPNSNISKVKLFVQGYINRGVKTYFPTNFDWNDHILNEDEKSRITQIRLDKVPYIKGWEGYWVPFAPGAEKNESETDSSYKPQNIAGSFGRYEDGSSESGSHEISFTMKNLFPNTTYGNDNTLAMPFYAQFAQIDDKTYECMRGSDSMVFRNRHRPNSDMSPDNKLVMRVNNLQFPGQFQYDSILSMPGSKGLTAWAEWTTSDGIVHHSNSLLVPSFKTLIDLDEEASANASDDSNNSDNSNNVSDNGSTNSSEENYGELADSEDYSTEDFGDFGDLDDLGDLGDFGDLDDLGDLEDLDDLGDFDFGGLDDINLGDLSDMGELNVDDLG